MKLATAEIMRKLDRRAVDELGLPGRVLMENAARGTVAAMFRHFPDLTAERVAILAGRGNNGGDGFAVARYLLNRGVSCPVFLFAAREEVKGDAAANLEVLGRMGGEVFEILNMEEWEAQRGRVESCGLIVDAIFGTGLKGEVKGFFQEIIEFVNSLARPVVAVDIPSGLDSDTGKVLGTCVRASLTVTFGLLKRGLAVLPGAECCGRVVLVDISIPQSFIESEEIHDHLIEASDLLPLLPPRGREAHKGQFGHLFVLAGSPGKTGAAAIVCESALRVGTGLITLGIPRSLNGILEAKLTEPMTEPLAETKEGTLSLSAQGRILELCARKHALAIGPGLSVHPETAKLIQRLARSTSLPAVIDADGLHAFSGRIDWVRKAPNEFVFTPHPGEMARLADISVREVQENRIGVARDFARNHGITLVLKGACSVIASPEGDVYINPTGNPGMASGGMGDVLTGMIGGFLAQGLRSIDAARLGVYLHGLVGNFVAFRKGERGMAASDLIEHTPNVLGALASGEGRLGDFSFPMKTETWY